MCDLFQERLAELEKLVAKTSADETAAILRAMVKLMASAEEAGVDDHAADTFHPATLDGLVAESALLRSLSDGEPGLFDGFYGLDSHQHWIASRKPEWVPSLAMNPDKKYFVHPWALGGYSERERQAVLGLHTSTQTSSGMSMWRMRLDLSLATGGGLWRPPWRTWHMIESPDVRRLHIKTVADWVRLVEKFPRRVGNLLRIDWTEVSEHYDAVHVSPTVAFAADGHSLWSGLGKVAPTYIGSESTLWLRWAFERVEEVLP